MHHTYHTFMTRSHNVSYFLCNFIVVSSPYTKNVMNKFVFVFQFDKNQ